MKYYIYGLVDPVSRQIRYVGKALKPSERLANHIWKARQGETAKVYEWIRGLMGQGLRPNLVVLSECGDDWESEERRWIGSFPNLLNQRDGGRFGTYDSKTHCVNGHLYALGNTYTRTGGTGRVWRECRECRNAASRRHRARSVES